MTWFRQRRAPGLTGAGLLALLVVAVAVPSACVLWFMNEAVMNHAAAARQALTDAHRAQLRLVRSRLDSEWQQRAARLESGLGQQPGLDFQRLVTTGAADSIILLDRNGVARYPSLTPMFRLTTEESAASRAARASEERVRELVQAGQTRAAIYALGQDMLSGKGARGVDAGNRLIAADAQLLLIQLLGPSDPRQPAAVRRLAARLNDYADPALGSAQRLFLMRELQSIAGPSAAAMFPTMEAEALALTFLERERRRPAAQAASTAESGVWQVVSPSRTAIGLYTSGTVTRAIEAVLQEQASPEVAFRVMPPGGARDEEAIAIGPFLPGWEVTFAASLGTADAQLTRSRRNAYLAVAVAAIGIIAAAVLLLGGAARRQARLASMKTDLVSAVSHELKTPLASMRLLVDALLEDDEIDPAKTRDYLRLMAVENARLTRLIENFLTFSRLERNRQRFEFAPADPGAIVRQALSALPEERRASHATAVEIAPDLPSIVADADAMVTVLLNLLDNAFKYSPAGEPVRVRVFREGEHVVFAVDDRGIGIPLREQKRIFRRFYRVDQRLARETAGSGLGLSIVDAIVRAHRGRVRVESRPAAGSTFSVYLPCEASGAPV